MSRARRERRLEAEQRWPTLSQAIGITWCEDQASIFESEEKAIQSLAVDYSLDWRQRLLKEWRDCNDIWGWQPNFHRLLQDGFHMNRVLKDDVEARKLWNKVYDVVIESVRSEFQKQDNAPL